KNGKSLAAKTRMQFLDLDAVITESAGLSVNEIFAQYGENYFREMESALLKNTASVEHAIIACGGGTPCYFDNMDWILANGKSIYLTAPEEILFGRLREKKEKRPLLRNMDDDALRQYIATKLAVRLPFYLRANAIVDTSLPDKEEKLFKLITEWEY
ncbi:MAG: shikimate kinase, partial [Chitinophagales bacterium]